MLKDEEDRRAEEELDDETNAIYTYDKTEVNNNNNNYNYNKNISSNKNNMSASVYDKYANSTNSLIDHELSKANKSKEKSKRSSGRAVVNRNVSEGEEERLSRPARTLRKSYRNNSSLNTSLTYGDDSNVVNSSIHSSEKTNAKKMSSTKRVAPEQNVSLKQTEHINSNEQNTSNRRQSPRKKVTFKPNININKSVDAVETKEELEKEQKLKENSNTFSFPSRDVGLVRPSGFSVVKATTSANTTIQLENVIKSPVKINLSNLLQANEQNAITEPHIIKTQTNKIILVNSIVKPSGINLSLKSSVEKDKITTKITTNESASNKQEQVELQRHSSPVTVNINDLFNLKHFNNVTTATQKSATSKTLVNGKKVLIISAPKANNKTS